jgi:hypothetical protein
MTITAVGPAGDAYHATNTAESQLEAVDGIVDTNDQTRPQLHC